MGVPTRRRRIRTRLLDRNPCLWLGGRHRVKRNSGLGVSGSRSRGWLAGYLKWPNDWLGAENYVTTGLPGSRGAQGVGGLGSLPAVRPDRRSGALELVLSTPLTVREILRGQMLASGGSFSGR